MTEMIEMTDTLDMTEMTYMNSGLSPGPMGLGLAHYRSACSGLGAWGELAALRRVRSGLGALASWALGPCALCGHVSQGP